MSRGVRAANAPAGSFSFFLVALVVASSCTSRDDDTGVVRSAATTPSFVQATYADPQSSPSSVSAAFTSAQTAGNLDVVIVAWSDSTTQVTSVTDSKGNAYQLAVGPTRLTGSASQSIYFAKNIAPAAAGANTVTVAFNAGAPFPDLRILEYGGMDPGTIVDVTAAATGNSATSNSGAVTTMNANDLLVGANYVATSSSTAGTNFTRRLFTSPDSDLVEDRVVTATGSYSATAALSPSGWWIMQMVAFRPPPAGPDTTPPTAPTNLTATTASGSQINLAWAAATDNVAVTSYLVESCQGTGCSSFAQIGTSTTLAFNNMGLTAGTSYSYRVRATDAAGNLGPYSTVASATTTAPDTTPPTAPANLTATVASNTQINLAWAAATDNVGVTN